MKTKNEKAVIAVAKQAQSKPQTEAETLRELLKELELRITRLPNYSAQDALEIPALLDQAAASLDHLHQVGSNTSSEESYFETIKAQFYSKRRVFLTRIGGAAVLAETRQKAAFPEDHWWWFVDQSLAQERSIFIKRVLIIAVFFVLLAAGFFVIYQRFWKPDPTLQASLSFQTTAENYLIEGRFEEALAEVNQALENAPDNPNLLILRGVIHAALDQPEQAEDDFRAAQKIFPHTDLFLSARAGYFLMARLPERALLDAEAAIEINPNLADAYLRKALAYEQLANIPMAIKYFELASAVAERTGNPQLQVIARMSMAQLLQSIPQLTPEPTE